MELETINKLYLELSHVADAKTQREFDLERMIEQLRDEHNDTVQQLFTVADLIKSGQTDDALSIISTLTLPF